MVVDLKKGQKVDLIKENGQALSKVMIGLGWDPVEQSDNNDGLFSSLKKVIFGIDCDAAVLLCQNGKIQAKGDVVSFLNLKHVSGAVQHMGDNLTGEGKGDDEQIFINLSKLPDKYDKLVFVVNVFGAKLKKQHFGMIRKAYIRIVDNDNNEFCRYELSEGYDGMTAMIFGEIFRSNNEWKFNAIGKGTTDGDLNDVVKRYI